MRSLAFTSLFVLATSVAQAKPDPMTAGASLERVVIEAGGDVRVTFAETQHLRLDGKEQGVAREGGVVTIRRPAGVSLTMPARAALDVRATVGRVLVVGDSHDVVIRSAMEDVEVRGGVQRLKVEGGRGRVQLGLRLSEKARVKVTTGAGDVGLTLIGPVRPKILTRTKTGAVRGAEAFAKASSAGLSIETESGDVSIASE